MSILGKSGNPTDKNSQKKAATTRLLIAVSLVLVVAIVTVVAVNLESTSSEKNTETMFVEKETEVVKKNEIITINDPSLGTITIDAVEGFAKNTYDNDSFITDDSGMMTYYIDGEVASCMGIDLSEYQGVIDFEKVKKQGFDFVMLRIGGRYYSDEGKMYVDTNYHQYYKAAKDAGLKVGGYFFSQARNAEEAVEEAEFVLQNIRGMDLDYPVAFDWEIIEGDSARTDTVLSSDLTQSAIAFCDTIEEAGFKSIIYSNTHLMYYMYDLELLKDYEFWIADYENHPSMYYHFTMWQYNIEGQVDGIEGNVDMNICMKNY